LLAQAEQLAEAHDWSGAADICKRAVGLVPNDIVVVDKLGWYISRAKRYGEAIEVYQDLGQRDPNRATWPYMVGYQYYDQGQWREAIKWFSQALELWDTYLVVLYRKGYAHAELNEPEKAKQLFEKCTAVWRGLDGEDRERGAKYYSDACFQLGKLLLSRGQSRNAEGILSEAVRYGPPDGHKHYNFAKALLRNGKFKEALDQLRIADRVEPNKDYILVYMARAYMSLEDYQKAKEILERIPASRRKAYVWHEIGKLRLKQGQPAQAIEALMRATKLDPRNHNQHYSLGQAYEGSEELVEAHKAYTDAIRLRQLHYNLEFPEAQERLAVLEQLLSIAGIKFNGDDGESTLPDGYIKAFKVNRGFGFISRGDGTDLFFHISEVANPDAIEVGAGVTFKVENSPKGPRATEVSIIS
jgi:CspA family cold shock protein